ncbi:LPXTG cell wall anchor domain-containing protein [Sphingobacterium griseoflavum]|uniref:Gram-positive cocci surface proteins LPxTG domain-containing protein n=1 Tax=Sphingobacterium griseoflavum TaxID=1474952 RepID=A0ABQ3HUF3_9SPHI|nr:LPXTG cell wall anchor domain-containing protein [Sphingobacterium griseoflavum]GHE35567.1 hypothetical protein GCM10017764_18560 [Sphingobacterium griseoflavum]
MKPRSIVFGIITAFVALILFNNREEASFWFFGEVRTSKLLILGAFFVIGMLTGGILFRRRRKRIEAAPMPANEDAPEEDRYRSPYSNLSPEDRRFLGKEDE